MKILKDLPIEKYNDVEWVLNYLEYVYPIGSEDVEPIEYFHCFWKGQLSDLHLMSLDSLYKTHPNVKVILWTSDSLEVQGTYSWIKIKKLLKDNIEVVQLTKEHFKVANAGGLFAQYTMLTFNNPNLTQYNHNLAYASDIIRFIVLYIYGGIWFDLDVLFLRNLDSIKIKRYVSQWGTDMCGNAAIMRLEKNHDLIKNIMGRYHKPFYPTTTFKLDNDLDLTMLPSTFFDILWRPEEDIPDLQFKTFDEFFNIEEWMFDERVYAYHWHNRWQNEVPLFFKNQSIK